MGSLVKDRVDHRGEKQRANETQSCPHIKYI
jgi:hypothetical protein